MDGWIGWFFMIARLLQHRYTTNNLDLYCVLNQTRPLAGANVKANSGGAPRWQPLSRTATLGELLRLDGYVIPGIVTVHVVVRGSPVRSFATIVAVRLA